MRLTVRTVWASPELRLSVCNGGGGGLDLDVVAVAAAVVVIDVPQCRHLPPNLEHARPDAAEKTRRQHNSKFLTLNWRRAIVKKVREEAERKGGGGR